MFNRAFFTSAAGRIATTTATVAVAGAGLTAIAGPGHTGEDILTMTTLLVILGSILTVGFAVTDFWREGVALIIGLPILGIYFYVLYQLIDLGTTVGFGLVLVSLLPLTETLFARAPAKSASQLARS